MTIVCPALVADTALFAGVKLKYPWLTPSLTAANVADRIIQAIERRETEVFMPWFVQVVPFLRLLPTVAFDYVQRFLDVQESFCKVALGGVRRR